ncbi:MAG: DUF5665 domain-containing protein [Candidatus Saccharimonadales bacterium]
MAEKKKKMGILSKFKRDNENGARHDMLEELFMDFNRNRVNIYKINFVRGLFFGLGSVLGGTLLVALLLWILNVFTGWFPALNDFIGGLTDTVHKVQK